MASLANLIENPRKVIRESGDSRDLETVLVTLAEWDFLVKWIKATIKLPRFYIYNEIGENVSLQLNEIGKNEDF